RWRRGRIYCNVGPGLVQRAQYYPRSVVYIRVGPCACLWRGGGGYSYYHRKGSSGALPGVDIVLRMEQDKTAGFGLGTKGTGNVEPGKSIFGRYRAVSYRYIQLGDTHAYYVRIRQ